MTAGARIIRGIDALSLVNLYSFYYLWQRKSLKRNNIVDLFD